MIPILFLFTECKDHNNNVLYISVKNDSMNCIPVEGCYSDYL